MSVRKRKTADAATPAIRMQKKVIKESVPQETAKVNDGSVTDDPETFYRIGMDYLETMNMADGTVKGKTSFKIAKKYGIGSKTADNASYFARGINAIMERSPELAEKMLHVKRKGHKQDIQAIGMAEHEERERMIDALLNGRPINAKRTKTETQAFRRKMSEIDDIISGMFAGAEPVKYNIDSLLRDIRTNTEPMISALRRLVEENKALCIRNKSDVMRTLIEVMFQIEKIEEEVRNL